MTEFIKNFIGNDFFSSVIMSFIPLIELKGGIVFARGVGFSFLKAFGLCYLGSTAVFFPVFFLLKPILNLLKKNKAFSCFSRRIEVYFEEKADGVIKKSSPSVDESRKSKETFYKCVGVFLFVAIPLPMTGVWTGTAIAVFLGLKLKEAVLPVILGNAVAGLIISALSELFLAVWDIAALDYVLWGLFAIALIVLVITVIKTLKAKPDNRGEGKR